MKTFKIITALLAILNTADAIFTHLGLMNQYITEENPLMDFLWNTSPWLFLFAKGILTGLLIILTIYFKCEEKHQLVWNSVFGVVLILYVFIVYLHANWIFIILQGT